MIRCEDLSNIFEKNELTFFSGVPDSTFKEWMKFLADGNGMNSISAINECEAAAICAGYYLATGKIGVLYMQNSGLGKIVNPHTSLLSKDVYSIPSLFMIGWRGEPGEKDEPEHTMMGRIMISFLDVLEIPYKILPANLEEAEKMIAEMKNLAEEKQSPVAIIIKKGTLEEYIPKKGFEVNHEMTREEAIKIIINNLNGDEAIISTTGKTSRELFEYRKEIGGSHNKDFLTVGSMGCSSGIGLAIAINTERPVYILDGDGAVLMEMGILANIGNIKPKNLYHIIFDNHSYDSTGGQPTISDSVDFEKIGVASGYRISKTLRTKEELEEEIKNLWKKEGPVLLIIKVKKGARKDLGRPTIKPEENKKLFMDFLNTKKEKEFTAVFLAAGRGVRFGEVNISKPLIKIGDKTLIEHSLDAVSMAGIKKAIIVVGHLKEKIQERLGDVYNGVKINYIENKNYMTTNTMHSFHAAKDLIESDVILLESDLIYDPNLIRQIIKSGKENLLVLAPLSGNDDEVLVSSIDGIKIDELGKQIERKNIIGEFIGISRFSKEYLQEAFSFFEREYLSQEKVYYEQLFLQFSKMYNKSLSPFLVSDLIWSEIDTKKDLERVEKKILHEIKDVSAE